MSVTIKQKGTYKLVEAINAQKRLILDDQNDYEWIEKTDSIYLALGSSEKIKLGNILCQGDYFVMCARHQSPWENDMDYLALRQEEDKYHTYKLPYGFPTDKRQLKRLIDINQYIRIDALERSGIQTSGILSR